MEEPMLCPSPSGVCAPLLPEQGVTSLAPGWVRPLWDRGGNMLPSTHVWRHHPSPCL